MIQGRLVTISDTSTIQEQPAHGKNHGIAM